MASNLSCLGLEVLDAPALERLIGQMMETAELIGRIGELAVVRWQDAGSGARCTITTNSGQITGFLPGFSGRPGANLAGLTALGEELAAADVLDDSGELVTKMALEVEEHAWLGSGVDAGAAHIAALGVEVEVFADTAAFDSAPASLLAPEDEEPGEPPEAYLANGWDWPPRMAAESFISYGLFGSPEESSAHARLNAVVLSAERRRTALTGQSFIVARVRTGGFQADLCLPDQAVVPTAGNVVAGTVFLVGSVPALLPELKRRRRWPWQRG